jgi:hypothetical protein
MSACCEPPGDQNRSCPVCGMTGRTVDRITVKAMLRPAALARVTDSEHRFCATPGCPVVYFTLSDRFLTEEVGVPVFHKGHPGARTVCYCFGITEADIDQELVTSGRSTVVERISGLVKAGRCACEIKNPQGSCCLGIVAAVVKSAESSRFLQSAGLKGEA